MEDMEMDQELLAEFLIESNENLGDIEQQLLGLETNPDDMDSVNGIFRAIHTVKGTCGFLGLERLEALSHAAENLLGKIRSEKFSITPDLVSLLLEAVDAIKTIIAGLEESGTEPDTDYSTLTNRLKAATRAVEDMTGAGVEAEGSDEEAGEVETAPVNEGAAEPGTGTEAAADDDAAPKEPEGASGSDSASAESEEKPKEVAEPAQPSSPAPKSEEKQATAKAAAKPAADNTIRVDVDVVDDIMNQVGELVLTRNRLLQMVAAGVSPEVQRVAHYIDHTTTTLQEQVLRLRMQPVAGLWNRVPRVVRDLSRELGKKIRVEMEGQETELDRFILAALRDPMTHIIRNSCDHGVESPADRVATGKSEEGLIRLTARQESGNIVIEISDDGKGIDPAAVREKAVDMDVITRDTADRMSDTAALQLIFHPGLSTAKQVSKVSGRGVGMDVVRAEIEKTGGNVEVESQVGKGSTLRMRIPLTLAIIPALVVETSEQQFAVPQMN
ncbi:MAG TPA: chemotaxis protein CheA, partial [Mariprofundaceae bacterium]|nr:chemotaxis protein CheA [Mariprofundaceae bacterium]